MKTIEKFLNSGYYIFIIFLISYLSWTFYQNTEPYYFNIFNMLGVLLLLLIMTLSLSLFSNSMYSIPILVSLLAIINKSNMDFRTLMDQSFPYIAFVFLCIGPIVHIIRFKPHFKKGLFFLGLTLIALAYIIPLLNSSSSLTEIPISLIALVYLGIYMFLSSTLKGSKDYLFKILLVFNLTLTFQVFFYVYQGYILNPDLSFFYRIYSGWDRNLGWANINDMCFYISLTMPSYPYFIFKKPRAYLLWFSFLFPILAVILTNSRGGIIGFGLAIISIIFLIVFKGSRKHLIYGFVFFIVYVIIFILLWDVFQIWYELFLGRIGYSLNDFSSNRLFIYKHGIQIFLEKPIFGSGWLSIYRVSDLWFEHYGYSQRLFMFHSTIIHVLATMGLFGFSALLVHYAQIYKYFTRNVTLEKTLFLIGYFSTQIHGLIDNVQFAVPYSVLIVIILAVFETSKDNTIFDVQNGKYVITSSLL